MADDEKRPKDHAFTSLNHPEKAFRGYDDRGNPVYIQLYDVFEIHKDETAVGGVRYDAVVRDLTSVEVTKWIREHEYDA